MSSVFNDWYTKNHAGATQGPNSGTPSSSSGTFKLLKSSINKDTALINNRDPQDLDVKRIVGRYVKPALTRASTNG